MQTVDPIANHEPEPGGTPSARPPITDATTTRARVVDYAAVLRPAAILGALIAAVAPGVLFTTEHPIVRGSLSAYWDIDPRLYFLLPYGLAAILLVLDGLVSFISSRKKDYGPRFHNIVLGLALGLLTAFNKDDWALIHYPAAIVFFAGFGLVIFYTAALGIFGQHIRGMGCPEHNQRAERNNGIVSWTFLAVILIVLFQWLFGELDIPVLRAVAVKFVYFEVFALAAIALHFILGAIDPFPYNHYEFGDKRLNGFLRRWGIMRSKPAPPSA